jgi:hypothetical protein
MPDTQKAALLVQGGKNLLSGSSTIHSLSRELDVGFTDLGWVVFRILDVPVFLRSGFFGFQGCGSSLALQRLLVDLQRIG